MRTHIFLILLSIFNGLSNGDVTDCEMSSKQIHYHLRNDLLCDYYYDVRPKLDHRNATKIFVRMVVQSFQYDMYSSSLTVNSWLPMTWVDDHLKWTPANYDNVDLVHFPSSSIWTPDFALYNKQHQDSVQKIFDSGVDCIIRNTGKVVCVPPSKHEATCTADLRKYPYDQQKCVLRFGSWVHTGEEIDFRLTQNPVDIEEDTIGVWKLLNVSVKRNDGKYSCCPNDTYPSIDFIFTLQRLTSYHEALIIVPGLAIIAVTLIILSLNADEMERFWLIIADIFFHFVYMQNLTYELPDVGIYPPNIIMFARDSLLLCLIEFIVTLMLRRLIRAPFENVGWVSGAIGTLVQSRVGQAILVFDNSVKAVAIAKGEEDGDNIIEKSQTANNLDYIVFAKLLDRLLCAIFIVIYVSMFIRLVP